MKTFCDSCSLSNVLPSRRHLRHDLATSCMWQKYSQTQCEDCMSFRCDIIIRSFCCFSLNIYTPTLTRLAQTYSSVNSFRALPNVRLLPNEWGKVFFLCLSCFSSSKIQFSLKELCQIAAGAVSTCFIYSSAFKIFFLFQSFVFHAQMARRSMWTSPR